MLGLSERTSLEESTSFCEYRKEDAEVLLDSNLTLAVIPFASHSQHISDPRYILPGLKPLASSMGATLNERFLSTSPVLHGHAGDIAWSESNDLMMCSIHYRDASDIEALGERSYLALLDFIAERGYPHILRAWNYFDGINKGDGDHERYKQFCVGRHRAFAKTCNSAHRSVYPAASALGCDESGLFVYALASKTPGAHFENPVQVSAYRYPREYGPKSPSFARGTLHTISSDCARVYISGTASIKGHESLFPNQTEGQLRTTIDNIEQLITHIQSTSRPNTNAYFDVLKVYIRNENDLSLVRNVVEAHFKDASICYVRGDICRQELNVEIDGICSLRAEA